MTDQLTLAVDGKPYEGWTDARITRSYLQFVPAFELGYTPRWQAGRDPWPILPGSAFELSFGSHLLMTGYTNRATWSISGSGFSLSAGGRAKTQDLVDCSAVHASGQWRNQSMRKIASDLCAPHGIPVQLSEPDSDKFKRFVLDEGETVFDAIDRMARLRGYLPVTHPTGALILVRTENTGRTVTLPVREAISRELEADDQNRFSEYRLRAQTGGNREFGGEQTSAQKFELLDPGVERYRPCVIVGMAPGHRKEIESQARYERNIRAGQSARAIYTLPGIMAPDGRPWAPGMNAHVVDRQLFTDRTLLVAEVEITLNTEGFTSRLTLVKRESFTLLDLPPKDKKAVI